MDVLSLFGGGDNLYKYLFMGGIGMIVLSLFYPLNRKYEYKTQRDTYNNEVKILNHDIQTLNNNVIKLSSQSAAIQSSISKIDPSKVGSSVTKKQLKDSFLKQYDSIINFRTSVEKKNLAIEFNKKKIETLNEHIKDFTKYEDILFYTGIIFSIIGVFGWFSIMKFIYKKPN